MDLLSRISMLVFVSTFIGCACIDPNSAKALGDAGQSAAQALADQTEMARKTIDALPEWWGVHDALVCSNAAGPIRVTCLNNVREQLQSRGALLKAQSDLSSIMAKRGTAASALRDAYQAFVNLGTYDAGAETEQAIKGAVGAINELTRAAAAVAPQGIALSAISSTFTSTASGIGSFIASERQKRLMLTASHDLHIATDAMVKALAVERDSDAIKSLLSVLQAESDQLYSGFVKSGLIATRDALAPLLMQIAPGAQMVEIPPTANADVITTAAEISIAARSSRQQTAVIYSYDTTLAALKSLSGEHAKFEGKQQLNLESVLSKVKRVQRILADLQGEHMTSVCSQWEISRCQQRPSVVRP